MCPEPKIKLLRSPPLHRISITSATAKGKRAANQDSYGYDQQQGLAVIADGMGGHVAGEVASRLAADALLKSLTELRASLLENEEAARNPAEEYERIAPLLSSAVSKANECVYLTAESEPEKRGMGTTLDAVVVLKSCAYITHVGDSRVYWISRGACKLVTQDHSLASALIATGRLPQDSARLYRNVLLRSVGTSLDVTSDIYRIDLKIGDFILLCTDGVWEYFPDPDEIATIVRKHRSLTPSRLVQEAMELGGEDNATAVLIYADASS